MLQLQNLSVDKAPLWLVQKQYLFSSTHSELEYLQLIGGESPSTLEISEDGVQLLAHGDDSVEVEGQDSSPSYDLKPGDKFYVAGTKFELVDPKKQQQQDDKESRGDASAPFVLISERGNTESFVVDKDKTVGRSKDCDITVRGARLSRTHAKFTLAGGKCLLEDLGSLNGTFLNGDRIETAYVSQGDRVSFAEYAFRVAIQSEDDLDKTKARPVRQSPSSVKAVKHAGLKDRNIRQAQKNQFEHTLTGLTQTVHTKEKVRRPGARLALFVIITIVLGALIWSIYSEKLGSVFL